MEVPRVKLRPIINASGAVTRLGGAAMPEAVLRAHNEAAEVSVSMEELQAAAARRIAEVCGTESGLVTSGAAAGLTLGAAAILAGHDLCYEDLGLLGCTIFYRRRLQDMPLMIAFPFIPFILCVLFFFYFMSKMLFEHV